jgi:hypothetical protein
MAHGSSATIVATVSENTKVWWDDILWSQVPMMTWSHFLEVSILDTQDEKASLRNWFGGAMCEVFSQNAGKRLDLCYGVFEVFLKQKPKNLCVILLHLVRVILGLAFSPILLAQK